MSIEIQGLDVSKYQGDIDWSKVKAAGKEFVFVRLGWCGFDGAIVANGGLDVNFRANVEGAIAAGLKVGIYVYAYALTPKAATAAARETIALAQDYPLQYPIVFDMEDTQTAGYNTNTREANSAIAKAFLTVVEDAGYTPLFYTYTSFANNYLDMKALDAYDLWIAQYGSRVTYNGSYTIWQYTGSGTCDGITGPCDLNIAYKDYTADSTDTGTEDTNTEETGSEETGSEETGSEETGSEETDSEDTGSEDTGSEETDSEETDSEDTSTEDTNTEETGSEDTSNEETDSEDTSSEGTGNEETDSEDTGSEDTSSEDTGNTEKPFWEKLKEQVDAVVETQEQ